jgi:hypothetical protein
MRLERRMAFGVPIPGVPNEATGSVMDILEYQLMMFAQDITTGQNKKGLQQVVNAFHDDDSNSKQHEFMMEAPKVDTLF